jgi:hypothetical protein
MPEPPTWGNRRLPNYEHDIQPNFEKRCTDCHGEETGVK